MLEQAAAVQEKTAAYRERFLAQDKELLKTAGLLAARIKALPPDPKHPDWEPRALIVGGFVRDSVAGLHPKDADLEVYGLSLERLSSVLAQYFPDQIDTVGKAFTVTKINLDHGISLDVSIPRRDSKSEDEIQAVGDPTMTIKEAATRRDFTMNSLSADPLTGEIFDPYGGIADIENRVLRVTDANQFQEDPLRVYRACQFVARLNLKPEPKTFALMKEMVDRGDMETFHSGRLLEEIRKLLLKPEKPSKGFELMRDLGIIEKNYPELHALTITPQEPDWHPEGNVWIHTMMCVDAAARLVRQFNLPLTDDEKMIVMAGALCHDLGKATTTKILIKDGISRITSHGHEPAGKKPTEAVLKRWPGFRQDLIEAVQQIVGEHLMISMLYFNISTGIMDEKQYANAVRKLLRRIHPASWPQLLLVSESDHRGRGIGSLSMKDKDYAAGNLFRSTIETSPLAEHPQQKLLQGRDLLELGLEPGRRIGELIKQVEEARDRGEIETREQALALVKELLGI